MAQSILIVEDDPDVAEALAWNLEREGFEVRKAPDGLQALSVFEASSPDVVILDLMLPGPARWRGQRDSPRQNAADRHAIRGCARGPAEFAPGGQDLGIYLTRQSRGDWSPEFIIGYSNGMDSWHKKGAPK